jgi:hypothetical protein
MLEQSGFVNIRIGPAADTSRSTARLSWPANRNRRGRARDLFQLARSVAHVEPRQVLLKEYMPRWPKFGGAIERADMEMSFSRQP